MSASALFKAGKGAQGLAIAAVIGVAIFGVVWLIRNREKFDITSDKNFAYQAAGGITEAITGVEGDTLGVALNRAFGDEPDYSVPEKDLLRICRVNYARTGRAVPQCVDVLTKYGT